MGNLGYSAWTETLVNWLVGWAKSRGTEKVGGSILITPFFGRGGSGRGLRCRSDGSGCGLCAGTGADRFYSARSAV